MGAIFGSTPSVDNSAQKAAEERAAAAEEERRTLLEEESARLRAFRLRLAGRRSLIFDEETGVPEGLGAF